MARCRELSRMSAMLTTYQQKPRCRGISRDLNTSQDVSRCVGVHLDALRDISAGVAMPRYISRCGETCRGLHQFASIHFCPRWTIINDQQTLSLFEMSLTLSIERGAGNRCPEFSVSRVLFRDRKVSSSLLSRYLIPRVYDRCHLLHISSQ